MTTTSEEKLANLQAQIEELRRQAEADCPWLRDAWPNPEWEFGNVWVPVEERLAYLATRVEELRRDAERRARNKIKWAKAVRLIPVEEQEVCDLHRAGYKDRFIQEATGHSYPTIYLALRRNGLRSSDDVRWLNP